MQIKRYRDWPIRLKVVAILLVCCLLPLPLLSIYRAKYSRMEEESLVKAKLTLEGSQIQTRIDQTLKFGQEATESTTQMMPVIDFVNAQDNLEKRAQATKFLEISVANLLKYFRGVAVLDNSGRVLLTTKNLEVPQGSILPFAYDSVIKQEKPLITDLYFLIGRNTLKPDEVSTVVADESHEKGKFQPSIAFIGLIPENKEQRGESRKPIGYVVLWLRAKSIWRHFYSEMSAAEDTKPRNSHDPDQVFFTLVDDHGVIIAHSDRKKLFQRTRDIQDANGARSIQNRFGPSTEELLNSTADSSESIISVDHRLANVPWKFFSSQSKKRVDEIVNSKVWTELLSDISIMFLVALIATLLGEILFTRQILKPIRGLAKSMAALRSGDLHSRIPFHSADEIGRLGQGFNAMAEQLETTIAAQKASEARLRAIVETAGDGIITVTGTGVIESFNGAASRMFGYAPHEVIGQNIALLLASCDAVQPTQNFGEQLGAGAIALGVSQEVEGIRKDCSRLPMEVTFSKVGQLALFTATMHDLTRRKATEQELRRAKEIAEEHDRVKSLFLASMSHELRTPLTIIIGYTEILQEEAEEKGLSACLTDLQEMNRQAHHLLTLINDILDMSKIEAGKVQLYHETFDVAKVIQEVAITVKPLVAKNNNTLKIELAEDLGTMHTDVTRVRQCLLNLLSNASKFTKDGSITIKVAREATSTGDMVSFEVRDTGIGMSDEQMRKVFQPFTQADPSTTRKYGGTGLGLTITSRLCQFMGGTIDVRSKPGQGCTFTLRLPAEIGTPAKAVATTSPSAPPDQRQLFPNTVLVVDDEPAARDLISRSLTQEGYHVVLCGTGEECLRLAKELQPQAITLDVMMPGMDGWAVLSALKSDPATAAIPVVILSIIDDKNLGHALGACDYLVKPVNRDRLLDVLKQRCKLPSSRLALVAEDDPAMRDMLRRCLEKADWSVYEAANGREALACVAQRRPAIILLDLMMPEMDGFEFLVELRQNPDWHSIPVVVITAKDLNEEERLFLNGSLLLSGSVKQILQKGAFNRDQLLREVRNLVAGSVN